MNNSPDKKVLLKVFMAIIPSFVFVLNFFFAIVISSTNHSFFSNTPYLILVFFVCVMVLTIWNVWYLINQNLILERYFKLAEIGFFFLPISALVFTLIYNLLIFRNEEPINYFDYSMDDFAYIFGSGFGKAIIALLIGIPGGLIMHFISRQYKIKGIEARETDKVGLRLMSDVSNRMMWIGLLMVILPFFGRVYNKPEKINNEAKSILQEEIIEDTLVELNIFKKEFVESDFLNGQYEEYIALKMKFFNRSGKEIRGFKGIISFYDIFDEKIYAAELAYDEGLQIGEEKKWEAFLEYNIFDDEIKTFKNTDLKNLTYKWKVEKIVYKDDVSQ